MKKVYSAFAFALALSLSAFAEGLAPPPEKLALIVQPRTILPIGASGELLAWDVGGQLMLRFAPLENTPLIFDAGFGYDSFATRAETGLTTLAGFLDAGVHYPLSRLFALEATLGAGYSQGTLKRAETATSSGGTSSGGAFRFMADAGIRFNASPSFAMELSGGYVSDAGLFQGINVGVRSIISLDRFTGSPNSTPKARIELLDAAPIYPVFYSWYDKNPLGTAEIANGEAGTITDVQVSFFMKEYMSAPKVLEGPQTLARGDSVTVDLTALFRSELLSQVEQSSVSATIAVDYTWKGQKRHAEMNAPFTVLDRNALAWDDDRKAAAFVSAKDPSVMELARNSAALMRDADNPLIPQGIRNAAAVFTALGNYGISYSVDPNSSYQDKSENAAEPDYLQFPRQTLTYRAGDCDDLSILYCSLLEALGIPTAFITVPGHIYVAFDPGLSPKAAEKIIADGRDYIVSENRVWIPVEITMVGKNFFDAWKQGLREWQNAAGNGAAALIPVTEAWTSFPSVALQDQAGSALERGRVNDKAILQSTQSAISAWAKTQIAGIEKQIKTRPEGPDSPEALNALGTLYARFGDYETAAGYFTRASAARPGYYPAVFNTGNVYYIQGQYAKASSWYAKARALKPQEPALLIATARNEYELSKYPEAKGLYGAAVALDPALGPEYAYLGAAAETVNRADSDEARRKELWSE